MFFGSQILIFYAVEFFAALNNTCISDRTLLLWLIVPTENITLVALRQRYAATRPNNSGTYSKKLTDMAWLLRNNAEMWCKHLNISQIKLIFVLLTAKRRIYHEQRKRHNTGWSIFYNNNRCQLDRHLPCRRICSNDAIVPADFPCRRICTNKTNVPADLQSAGIEYKDFQSAYFLFFDL